jgi:two-component system response regulator FixJ
MDLRQVLSGVVAGLPNKSIAFDLDISPRTVEVHRASVMSKMQAKSLPELVRMVLAANQNRH